MSSSTSKLERGLLVVAGVLAVLFFVAALFSPAPWSDLLIGMATSFVFFVVFDLILALRRFLVHRRRRSFFGSDMFDDEVWLALADFELRTDITQLLTPEQLRAPYQRPRVPGVPEHPHPIVQTTMMCLMDIRAIAGLAEELAPWCARPPKIVVDTELIRNRARSFIASGLTDNHCTALYLVDDPCPLFELNTTNDVTTATLADGRDFVNSPQREYGFILRYRPDPILHQGRCWFFVAGLDEAGSAAAGHYLAKHWSVLAAQVPSTDDFIAVLDLPIHAWWEPNLIHIVSRDSSGKLRSTRLAAEKVA